MEYQDAISMIENYYPIEELVRNNGQKELSDYQDSHPDYDPKNEPTESPEHIFAAFWRFQQGEEA
jgi:hypothetical protein